MKPTIFSFPASNFNAIAATQTATAVAGGTIVINGASRDFTQLQTGVFSATPGGGIQRTLGVFSTGNMATIVFYASGLDLRGVAVSASYVGPSGGSSTATDAFATFSTGGNFEFARVNTITCTVSATMTFTVGWGATGSTNFVQMDSFKNPFSVGVAVVTATIASVTIQDTPSNPNTTSNPTVFNHSTLAGVVANQESNYAFPVRYVRGIVSTNSATGVGSTITIIQSG